jgi:hypothetical protein
MNRDDVEINFSEMGDAGCAELLELVNLSPEWNASIVGYCFAHNEITDEGLVCLCSILDMPSSRIKYLSLSGNSEISEIGINCLSATLSCNQTIESLKLARLDLNDEKCYVTSQAIEGNSTLKDIDFATNEISDEGFSKLIACIAHSKIRLLDFMNNSISFCAIPDLESLLSSTMLQDLCFCWNDIKDEGCLLLGVFIQNNSSLTRLNLAFNSIGDEGVEMIASSLLENQSLLELMLSGNKFGSSGCKVCHQACYTIALYKNWI